MKIVVAMDSFKGTQTAPEACDQVCAGIHSVRPDVEAVIKPMADGGEGTAEAIRQARNGEWITLTVTGPLPELKVAGGFAWFADDRDALVEMAVASGITLLRPEQLNPSRTTTYGTGELIRAAVERGAKRIRLAVGGSATVDGGIGAAGALGWSFLDGKGRPVELCGGSLGRIETIRPPPLPALPPVEVLCDVNSVLCGAEGAARLYGPQKGATPAMVEELDQGLAHLANRVEAQLGVRIKELPGAGAAGGLAAGAVAFMGARLVPGIETVMAISRLEDALRGADWIITGEGKFDGQSLRGKVVSGIVRLARGVGTRVAVLAGSVQVEPEEYRAWGVEAALGTQPSGMPLAEAMEKSKPLLREAAARFAREHLM
jgi:glycerate kinase